LPFRISPRFAVALIGLPLIVLLEKSLSVPSAQPVASHRAAAVARNARPIERRSSEVAAAPAQNAVRKTEPILVAKSPAATPGTSDWSFKAAIKSAPAEARPASKHFTESSKSIRPMSQLPRLLAAILRSAAPIPSKTWTEFGAATRISELKLAAMAPIKRELTEPIKMASVEKPRPAVDKPIKIAAATKIEIAPVKPVAKLAAPAPVKSVAANEPKPVAPPIKLAAAEPLKLFWSEPVKIETVAAIEPVKPAKTAAKKHAKAPKPKAAKTTIADISKPPINVAAELVRVSAESTLIVPSAKPVAKLAAETTPATIAKSKPATVKLASAKAAAKKKHQAHKQARVLAKKQSPAHLAHDELAKDFPEHKLGPVLANGPPKFQPVDVTSTDGPVKTSVGRATPSLVSRN